MASWHRFDLVDSSYAMGLMAQFNAFLAAAEAGGPGM
jgi:hypothetical protein